MKEQWSKATVILHWLAASFLVANVLIGVSASGLAAHASARLVLARLHAIGGAALMLLIAGRLVARRSSPTMEPLPVSPTHWKGSQPSMGVDAPLDATDARLHRFDGSHALRARTPGLRCCVLVSR
ncbi:MAG: cytochrome b/b6 domain-containing protein [Myxococcales bacterium]|nr:cytochrome b/b6 domain-containing protein [Myxococcales bacterium]